MKIPLLLLVPLLFLCEGLFIKTRATDSQSAITLEQHLLQNRDLWGLAAMKQTSLLPALRARLGSIIAPKKQRIALKPLPTLSIPNTRFCSRDSV